MSPRRPRMAPGFEPRLTPADELYLLRDWGAGDLVIETDGRRIAELLRRADGRRPASALARSLVAAGIFADETDVADALTVLADAGIVEDAAAEPDGLDPWARERFSRQVAYFGQLDGPPGAEAQQRLEASTVCIIGLGGLGSWTAWALASAGVGALVGVDSDAVELSNLNRQVLYREQDVGRSKTVAAGEALRGFHSRLSYRGVAERMASEDDVSAVIAGADLVVAAADHPPHLIDRWINAACFATRTPYLALSQQPPLIRVGPLFAPGETGCYACTETRYAQDFPLYRTLADAEQPFSPAATFGPACGAVGSLAASEVVHHLAGFGSPASKGCAILLDTATFEVTVDPVRRVPGCPVCGRRGT
jgi:bacteriocin biosynthesis cyclodehydratase domain-containing protein